MKSLTRTASSCIALASLLVGFLMYAPAPVRAVEPAPGTPDLQAASDSGFSSTDDITNVNEFLTFDISCITGDSVVLYADGSPVSAPVECVGGTVSITTEPTFPDDTWDFTATQYLVAPDEDGFSAALTVTVDTSEPSVTILGTAGEDYSLPTTCPSVACDRGDIFGDVLVFSEVLDADSKTDVEDAITAGASVEPRIYVWNGARVRIYATEAVSFDNDVTSTVTDLAGNEGVDLLLINSAPNVVYVDDGYTEEGENDGHEWDEDAFDDIQSAINSVAAGGTVNVASGSYVSTSTLTINKDGLDLVGPGIDVDEGDEAFITKDECNHAVSIDAENVTISGFYIEERFEGDYCTGGTAKPVIRVRGDQDDANPFTGVTITENDIAGGNRGIALRSDVAGTTISYNRIHDNYDGIIVNGTEGTAITNNEIYDNDTGIELSGDSGDFGCDECDDDLGGTSINTNDIHDNSDYGVYINGEPDVSGVTIESNSIYNGCEGIYIDYFDSDTADLVITHNAIYDNDNCPSGLHVDGGEEGSLHAQENWWGDATGPDTDGNEGDGDLITNFGDATILYRPFCLDEECATLSASAEATGDDTSGLYDSGAWDTNGDDPDETELVNVNEDTTITGGNSSVFLEEGTTITATGGGDFDTSDISMEELLVGAVTGLDGVQGVLQWGITDQGLTFSSPITVSIFVGTDLNGTTLTVKRSTSGTGDWTDDGIEPPGECTVTAGLCTFQTTKASFFAAATPSEGGGNGGGGYYMRPQTTPTPSPAGRGDSANLGRYGLREGDVTSGEGDLDVYIVNEWGYKRLFLNPAIFNFYGHLGGFARVRRIAAAGRDAFVTSGLFRNCESDDQRVFAVEVTAEDSGTLHHVQMSGAAAAAEDSDFFRKVFCINNNEFNWYPKSPVPYTSLSQVPVYRR